MHLGSKSKESLRSHIIVARTEGIIYYYATVSVYSLSTMTKEVYRARENKQISSLLTISASEPFWDTLISKYAVFH